MRLVSHKSEIVPKASNNICSKCSQEVSHCFRGFSHYLGVARGLLQGRPLQLPLGWRVGERARTKSGWLEVDQELDMGCQLLTRTFPCRNCRGLSCSNPLATFSHYLQGFSHYFREVSHYCPPRNNFLDILSCEAPRPATGVSRALRARSVPGVSLGVSLGPFGPGLRSVQKVSQERARRARETPVAGRGVRKF